MNVNFCKSAKLYSFFTPHWVCEQRLFCMKTSQYVRSSDNLYSHYFESSSRLDYAEVCSPCEDLLDDYFECLASSRGDVAFVIGERLNAGEPSLCVNSLIRHYFSAAVGMERQRAEVLTADLNDIVCAARETETPVSCFYAYYASDSGVLNYCNAGHQAPLLVRTNPNQVVHLKKGGPALGSELTPRYSAGSLQLRPGDRLIAFTRGVSEAWARAEDITGEATLAKMLKEWREERAADLAKRVIGDAPEHAFEQQNERVVFVATVRNAAANPLHADRAAMVQCAGTA